MRRTTVPARSGRLGCAALLVVLMAVVPVPPPIARAAAARGSGSGLGGPGPLVAAAGDIACAPGSPVTATRCHQRATSRLLGRRLAAVLPLGDLQYPDGSLSAFRASYGATWGRRDRHVRPVVGDNEYESESAAGYFAYMGRRAHPPRGYYAFDLGRWRLIALNSNCAWVACGKGSSQERWLRRELRRHRRRCQLAYWHAPLFNSGNAGVATEMRQIWRDLDRARVDVVLNGHDHHYERFGPQDARGRPRRRGIREFIVGTGGASHAAAPAFVAPNSRVRNYDTFGVLKLRLRPRSFAWRFAHARGGAFTDAGHARCH